VGHQRLDVSFDSGGSRCAAWLFLPDSGSPAPLVVMGHGFSGVRDMCLPAYAERFAEHGLASFVFDYRHFGDSEGEPRQLLSWRKQLDDWRAALAHVRRMEEIDAGRVAVWGTSFGGGHAVVTAAGDDGVMAAVAQVPFVDGAASLRTGVRPGLVARVLAAGVRDLAQTAVGMAPYYVPAVSPPEQFGCLNSADSYSGFMSLIPPDSTWRNQVAARVLLTIGSYRPIAHAPQLECPLLVVAARHDSLIPIAEVERLAAQAPSARLVILDAGHFEVYTGKLFDEVATLEAQFLAEHLLGDASRRVPGVSPPAGPAAERKTP
jgi:dienelactone hydrolase